MKKTTSVAGAAAMLKTSPKQVRARLRRLGYTAETYPRTAKQIAKVLK